MTVSGGVSGTGLGVAGVAVGGATGTAGVTTALATTGASHVADTIVFGIALLATGVAVLGVATRRRPRHATPSDDASGPSL
jgi:hypothetical protein